MKKLPIGLQDFGELRRGGFLYVDKTQYMHQMVSESKYYFLSRPRRFGKSLLISTLAELFKGNQVLFEDLWIADQWDWTQTHPVLDFRFNKSGYKISGLEDYLYRELKKQASFYDIVLEEAPYSTQFEELITVLSERHGRVVVLIDEYDKPILDYLHDIPQAEANREILKNFYAVLKPLDAHLRFVFLTGVSKFSRVSIFSELNNLLDLTIYADYATLLGYTQEELETYFGARIDEMSPDFGGREALLTKIKQWYNGYSWDTKNFVYNPFSILNFFAKRSFENFWFETGTPTFLLKTLNRERQYNLDNIRSTALTFGSFELGNITPEALLFQTGYLTLKAVDKRGVYTLSYPNLEVKDSLLQYLLSEYSHESLTYVSPRVVTMLEALEAHQVDEFVSTLNSLFASIPYQIFIAHVEAYYHSVTFLALSLMGSFVQVEASQAKGRPDAVVHTDDCIYVMEFKLDENAEAAMQQIKERGYTKPYLHLGKPVKAVGINFNSSKKEVDQWLEEEV